MVIFNKRDIDNIDIVTNSVVNDIQDFSQNLSSTLETHNEEFESRYDDFLKLKTNTINSVNDNSFFSDRVKSYLNKVIDRIESELDEENFELDFNIDENDVTENFGADVDRFLRNNLKIDDHMSYVHDSMDAFEGRLLKISNLSKYKKPKNKFVIEKRKGIICIKNKNHSNYLINKNNNISIDNEEVLFIKEGVFDEEKLEYTIPDSIVDEFKKIKKKLNKVLV